MQFANDLCVVGGAGHVGLPFALVFAEAGLRAAVYDKNKTACVPGGELLYCQRGAGIPDL